MTNLYDCGAVPDPFFENNFLGIANLLVSTDWEYTTTFSVPSSSSTGTFFFSSIKGGANIALNAHPLGTATDQFLPSNFSAPLLRSESNTLSVTFPSSSSGVETSGRFAACTGGWDWAPYTLLTDGGGRPILSFGVLGSVELVTYDDDDRRQTAVVTAVVPIVRYRGAYLSEAVHDEREGDFQIDVTFVFVPTSPSSSSSGGGGAIPSAVIPLSLWLYNSAFLPDGLDTVFEYTPDANNPNAETTFTVQVNVPKGSVDLWWPAGMGEQPLYPLVVEVVDLNTGEIIYGGSNNGAGVTFNVAFRSINLVTINDQDADAVDAAKISQGSGTSGMFFRVNGGLVFSRGANVIPVSQFEGHPDKLKTEVGMVRSAVAAGMNTLRVWGGGAPFSGGFYDECDRSGVLVVHDLMFVEEHLHGPTDNVVQRAEILAIVRALAYRPSVALWTGCNECSVVMGTSTEVYATFVMTVVAEVVRDSVPIWPSCPAAGWDTGTNTLTGLFNGEPLTAGVLPRPTVIEVHGPYQHGSSVKSPAVNGLFAREDLYEAQLPVTYAKTETGPEYKNQFVSEFGSSVYASFESMSSQIGPDHYSIYGNGEPDSCYNKVGNENVCTGSNVMAQRNYGCDNHILVQFGEYPVEVGTFPFQKQLYHCMLGQALFMKSTMEKMRSENKFGQLIWQLNENWATGGWGSIEFGVEGRWKILHHLLEKTIFRDTFASCGLGVGEDDTAGLCFVKHDGMKEFKGKMSVASVDVVTGVEDLIFDFDEVELKGGAGAIKWFKVPWASRKFIDRRQHALVVRLKSHDDDDSVVFENFVLLNALKEYKLQKSTLTFEVIGDGRVRVKSNGASSLFVTLTTGAVGRFSDNAFFLAQNAEKEVKFLPIYEGEEVDVETLRKTIRVEDVSLYL